MMQEELTAKLGHILSRREIEVVVKRLNNRHITQTESNYLSRSIRPKLESAEFAASTNLLSSLDYRRKKHERDDGLLRKKIIMAVQRVISNVKAIIVFGSYIRNSHTDYRDIDIMILLNKKTWKTSAEKHRQETKIEQAIDVKTDINLVVHSEMISLLPYSPLLQTELEYHKVIYGKVKLGKKIIINRAYLHRKLLEAEYAIESGKTIKQGYIYNAVRTCLSITLFLQRVVDNNLIIRTIEDNIGRLTAMNLMNNRANPAQRDIALRYLKYLYGSLADSLQ